MKILMFLLLATNCYCVELPYIFKKCNRSATNFNGCLATAVQDAVQQLGKPRLEIGLPSLEPVRLISTFVSLKPKSGPISLEQNLTRMDMYGLTTMEVSKLTWDFAQNTLSMDCRFPHLEYDSDYSVNGTVEEHPVSYTNGRVKDYVENAKFLVTFSLEEYSKNGKRYYRVVGSKFLIDAQWLTSDFNDNYSNYVFNKDWKLAWSELRHDYELIHEKYFSELFNSLLENVSISELFEN